MIPLALTPTAQVAYERRLFGSHDFAVFADVLDFNEKPQGTAEMLDGQVNLHGDATIRRTASLSISDPEGAFDFADASGWSPRSLWADRLVRVRHVLDDVSATCFVGPLSTIDRNGSEVRVECQDKTALAIHGCPPMTVAKGMNAVAAIEQIMRRRTGEFRFRFPKSKRRLSRAYSVGWDDDASPWLVCQRIARRELGMQLVYAADGFLLLRRKPSKAVLTVPHVTGEASMSANFTEMTNWVRVTGRTRTRTKNRKGGGTVKTTDTPQVTTQIKAGRTFSPQWRARKGVPLYWPTLLEVDKRNMGLLRRAAQRELAGSDQLEDAPAVTCVPFFHGDVDDLVRFDAPVESLTVRLGDCSLPLGTGGEMTVGAHRMVSRPAVTRTRRRILRTKKVRRPRRQRNRRNRRGD